MSDAEGDGKPAATPAAAAVGGPMDVNTALQEVLKTALIHDGLARGLHEAAKALDKRQAHLCVLANNCDEPMYVKLVEALCAEHGINLLKVDDNKKLGEWAGLCKIDREGKARKIVASSCVVVKVFPHASPFNYSRETITAHFHSPVVSLPDVQTSPNKRRVAVKAKVKEIKDMVVGPHYKRSLVVLTDGFDRTVEMKLWGKHAESCTLTANEVVLAKPLEVSLFNKNKPSLDTTQDTSIEIEDMNQDENPKPENVKVIAFTDNEIFTEDGCALKNDLPFSVKLTITGNAITEVHED